MRRVREKMPKTSNAKRLVDQVRKGLRAAADPERAPKMQSYMKSDMPYYGVPAPEQRKIFRRVFKDHPLGSFDDLKSATLTLWRRARFREERYAAAIELTGWRDYRKHQILESLPVYEEIITTGAWWDYVDAVAIHRIGRFLLPGNRGSMTKTLLSWSRSSDMWKRRSAIIAQVALKQNTDLELLYRCIENNLGDKEFFIRKGIGWALRAYAWIDPSEIERYVASKGEALSPLSRKEALRNTDRLLGRTRG